jgi:integrase
MREQKGCISIDRDCWSLRWRETEKEKRVMRFRSLTPVTAIHKRSKDRKTGKLKIPAEVQAMANEILAPLKRKPTLTLTSTIGELVDREYLPHVKIQLKPSSYCAISRRWECYLKARVSDRLVREFRRADAFDLWNEIHKAHAHLSRQTMSHIRFMLSGFFEFCLNRGLYDGLNPCAADLPAGLTPRKKGAAYTVEEIYKMLSIFSGNTLTQALIALAFGSGLRKGELSGLKWEDYETTDAGAIIHVRRSVWQGQVTAPKTESSEDIVTIGKEFAEYIEAFRQSRGNVTAGFMFGYSADRPLSMETFGRRVIRPVLEAAGMKWQGWHSFRRGALTFAAMRLTGAGLTSDGISDAQALGRQATRSVTLDHYIDATRQEKQIAEAGSKIARDKRRETVALQMGESFKQARPN